MSPAAHTAPHAASDEAATLAARMQAVEIVMTETLAALISAQMAESRPEAPMLSTRIAERTRRHIARMPADDAAFALELDRQATRLLRNIALRIGVETVRG